jgi:hypothetical protein
MSRFSRLLFAAPFASYLLWGEPGCAQAATPVPKSPHLVSVGFEYAALSSAMITVDGHHDDDGTYSGVSAGYMYQARPWFEWGGIVSYGQTSYAVSDRVFVACKGRAALALAKRRRLELGLSLAIGVLDLVVPDVKDDQDLSQQRDHHFLGVGVATGVDLRWWVLPSLAFTVGGEFSVGVHHDVSDVQGYYLATSGFDINAGTLQLGMLFSL